MSLAKFALSKPEVEEGADSYEEEFGEEERMPLLDHARRFMDPNRFREEELPPGLFRRSTSVGPMNWMEEFRTLNLPSFSLQYIQLVHVPLDVMHECLRLQGEMGATIAPSSHNIKQVMCVCVLCRPGMSFCDINLIN